jgi:translocation and assembly module TamA
VRGYGYQSIGPRNSTDRVIGGKNLLVASSEIEHYFTRNWGMAAFVDAGNAFSGTDYRPKIGAGLGLRWRSPVGMIRVDLGTPIHDDRAHGIQLHLVIGPDL